MTTDGTNNVASNSISDYELAQASARGDMQAFETIYKRHHRRVYSLCLRMVANATEAEDLTQEVFIRVYRSLNQYDPTLGDLSNWLMRLARNLVIDDYRKRQRTPTDSGDDLANHEYHLPAASDSPQRTLERQERRLQVLAAINKLSHDLRECVILRDIEELTYQEIVDLLKIPEGTVKSRINRGRIELAKVLRRMKVNPD